MNSYIFVYMHYSHLVKLEPLYFNFFLFLSALRKSARLTEKNYEVVNYNERCLIFYNNNLKQF